MLAIFMLCFILLNAVLAINKEFVVTSDVAKLLGGSEKEEFCFNSNECYGAKFSFSPSSTTENVLSINNNGFNVVYTKLDLTELIDGQKYDFDFTSYQGDLPIFLYFEKSSSTVTLNYGFTEEECQKGAKFSLTLFKSDKYILIDAYTGAYDFYIDPSDGTVGSVKFNHLPFLKTFFENKETSLCYNAYEKHTIMEYDESGNEIESKTKVDVMNNVQLALYSDIISEDKTIAKPGVATKTEVYRQALPDVNSIKITKYYQAPYAYDKFFDQYDWNISGKCVYIDLIKEKNQNHIKANTVFGLPFARYNDVVIPILAENTYVMTDVTGSPTFYNTVNNASLNVKFLKYNTTTVDALGKISIPATMDLGVTFEIGYYDSSAGTSKSRPVLEVHNTPDINGGNRRNTVQFYIQDNTVLYRPYFGTMTLKSCLTDFDYIYDLSKLVFGNLKIIEDNTKYSDSQPTNRANYVVLRNGRTDSIPFKNGEFNVKALASNTVYEPEFPEFIAPIEAMSIAIIVIVCIVLVIVVIILVFTLLRLKSKKSEMSSGIRI